MTKMRCLAAITLLLSPIALFASDPFLGKWVLDVQRSRYSSGSCPKQMTIEMSAEGEKVHYHSATQWANGRVASADYTAAYDGTSVSVLGNRGLLLPVSLKRAAPNVVVATYTSGFQAVATSRRVVSVNGLVMTVTTISRDVSGKNVTNVGVYRKAEPARTGTLDLAKIRASLLVPK